MLTLDAVRADDPNVLRIGRMWLMVGYVCVPVLVAWWAAEDSVAPAAVALNVDVIYCRDIAGFLIGRRIHPWMDAA